MNLEPGDFVNFEITDDKTGESGWMWLRLDRCDLVAAGAGQPTPEPIRAGTDKARYRSCVKKLQEPAAEGTLVVACFHALPGFRTGHPYNQFRPFVPLVPLNARAPHLPQAPD
jgi:hypothetical protein